MVKYLLQRPIAVTMTFVAIMLLGFATFNQLPVSLLPSIPIPEINVQATAPELSAQQIDNGVAKPLRRQLMQVGGLKEIKSQSQDGISNIKLKFDYETDINLAFIEVNEKIDAVSGLLPKNVLRPKAVKANATDIPVLYVNMTLKDTSEAHFLQMCDVARHVVQRRIEQLPEVAMTDMTGVPQKTIMLKPDRSKMEQAGVTDADLRNALVNSNVNPGTMTVHDGCYEYDLHIGSIIRTTDDVRNIFLNKNGRMYQIQDFCDVRITASTTMGKVLLNGKRAISLAVIKRGSSNMDALKSKVKQTLETFSKAYPEIDFTVNRNQTELLDYTISSLSQNFVLAFILMFVAALLFMGDIKAPVIVAICMIEAMILTFLFFFIFNISLNTISLSGMVLVVGMMIDNALIVTENISQHCERGETLIASCAHGTAEMITPMLSSSLTTVVVFVPLIFISDISGALFSDEAYSITFGLLSSYIVAVFLLPVVYLLVSQTKLLNRKWNSDTSSKLSGWMLKTYNNGINRVFKHKKIWLCFVIATLPLCALLFTCIPKELFPKLEQNDTTIKIDWNESIETTENTARTQASIKAAGTAVKEYVAEIGHQGYMLNDHSMMSPNESFVYLTTDSREQMHKAQTSIQKYIKSKWPEAQITFETPDNIFNKVFSLSEPDIVAEVSPDNLQQAITINDVQQLSKSITSCTGLSPVTIAKQQQITINVNTQKAMVYGLSINDLSNSFQQVFQDAEATNLKSARENMPVLIAGDGGTINNYLAKAMVPIKSVNGEATMVPVSEFISTSSTEGFKTIVAGKHDIYIPYIFDNVNDKPALIDNLKRGFSGNKHKGWNIDFSGKYFTSKETIRQLIFIFFVSLLLMYFILCAQFESFKQPLIVLLEIPIDTSLALATLWVCGYSLNIMSAIGIIASCGIVVNDSILKIDAINTLRAKGMNLTVAVHEAGHRRLRAIIMTSLTTITGMIPFFLSSDLGSELQRSLAVAMTSAIFFGTLVSLFIIPLIYCTFIKSK